MNDQHGTMTLKLQQWHVHLGGHHQQLSDCAQDLINMREDMFGSGNRVILRAAEVMGL